MIYLDHAASTPVLPQVKEKLIETLDIYGNPSSLHEEGQKAKDIISEAKNIISKRLKCSEDELYFTSGATMSNNILLGGFQGELICSEIEHDDILMRCKFNEKIPVNKAGYVNLDVLEHILKYRERDTLFSIQMANSEIGTIQHIKIIADLIHKYPGCFLHCDATQYVAHYPISVKEMGIDALSMSGQKIGCIKGTGLLYISNKLINHIDPIIYGKQGLIGGTENVLGIACLGEAFNHLDYNVNHMNYLANMLSSNVHGELIGADIYDRLPNNVCMYFKGIPAETIVMMLSEQGICCSAGSACSSNDNEPSSTLLAIGLSKEDANSCVRFTLSNNTTEEEILEVIDKTNSVIDILRGLY